MSVVVAAVAVDVGGEGSEVLRWDDERMWKMLYDEMDGSCHE